jgi:deoxyadenosine/deoxycytidine kinase
MGKRKFIAVAGNMGAGKTSLVEYLAAQYGFEPIYEPYAGNPYLDDFYADMGAWGFHSQLWFLTHKFQLHLGLHARTHTFVQDRTIYEDAEIFATNLARSGLMSDRDHQTYLSLYDGMRRALQPPDLMIYLRCSVKGIRRRIRKRGRASEQAIPLPYLKRLNALYEDWMERYDLSPKMVWESDDADYLTDLVDRLEFKRSLEKLL